VLAASDVHVAELERAEILVIGMPAQLKAWMDQVIGVNRTLAFDLARGDWFLQPGLDGMSRATNHLDTHSRTCAHDLRSTAFPLLRHIDALTSPYGVALAFCLAMVFGVTSTAANRPSAGFENHGGGGQSPG
jgi:hypothetical protein